MEFVEYIKSPNIDKVSLRRRGRTYLEGTLCVTGHHLIFSSRTDHKDELIVSHQIIYLSEFISRHNIECSHICIADHSGMLLLQYGDVGMP